MLDLDFLSWAGTGREDRGAEFGLMLRNLSAVAANYRAAPAQAPRSRWRWPPT